MLLRLSKRALKERADIAHAAWREPKRINAYALNSAVRLMTRIMRATAIACYTTRKNKIQTGCCHIYPPSPFAKLRRLSQNLHLRQPLLFVQLLYRRISTPFLHISSLIFVNQRGAVLKFKVKWELVSN